jgi:integrase
MHPDRSRSSHGPHGEIRRRWPVDGSRGHDLLDGRTQEHDRIDAVVDGAPVCHAAGNEERARAEWPWRVQIFGKRHEQPLPGSITAHTFRRTFITLMLEVGAPVPYVQAQVGHEDPTPTVEIYAQVLNELLPNL